MKENWEWTDINLLKVDGNNPNVMTSKEKEALKRNIEIFGWNMPIITNTEYLIADGEQKLIAAKEMGLTEVPILRKALTESDRLIIRQSMNKLRGSHQEDLDALELKRILETTELQSLTELTAISEQDILNLLNKAEKETLPKVEEVDKLYSHQVTCPKCGHTFQKSKDST